MSPLPGNFGHFVAAFVNGDRRSCERSAIQLDCHWVSLFRLIERRRSLFPSNPTCDRRRAALCCRGAPAPRIDTSLRRAAPCRNFSRQEGEPLDSPEQPSKRAPLTERLLVECPEQSVLTTTRGSGPGAQFFAHCSHFHDPAHVGVDQLFFVNASSIWTSMAQVSDHL